MSGMVVCDQCGHPIQPYQTLADHAAICDAGDGAPECDNCGMIDVPLKGGYCDGCICARCGRDAGEVGCSMNDMGWCDDCEAIMGMTDEEVAAAIASGAVPPVKASPS